MQSLVRSLVAALVTIALIVPIASSAQDEESSPWIGSWVDYRHETDADEVLWDDLLPSGVRVGSFIHTNDSSVTFVDPFAELRTTFTIDDWDSTEGSLVETEPGVYLWQFSTIVPPEFSHWAQVWLAYEETAPLAFQPGFTIARSVSPESIAYPGGEVTVTMTYTVVDNSFYGTTAQGAGVQAWGVSEWQEDADFMATVQAVIDYDGFGCDPATPGDMYAYCFSENYQVGTTYTIDVVFDVTVDEGTPRIDWMPNVSAELRFPEYWNEPTDDGTVTMEDEYATWNWFLQYTGSLLRSRARGKGVGLEHRYSSAANLVEAEIDIKPGGYPNSINARSKGKIPVAILATPNYDPLDPVSGVDPGTVRFAGAGKSHPNKALGHWEDVDGDGDTDLLLHFDTQEVFGNPEGLSCGDTEAVLTGFTYDGTSIQGMDFVVTVGCK